MKGWVERRPMTVAWLIGGSVGTLAATVLLWLIGAA